jgi:hypothetical protein
MKCTYCNALDHLETVCPTKSGDRRLELLMGFVFFIPMLPFYVAGLLGGMFWSAFKCGFAFTEGFWPQTWKAIRGGRKDDGESGSV